MDLHFRAMYEQLFVDDLDLNLESMIYFRQILSRNVTRDQNDFDLMLLGAAATRFVQFLCRHEQPKIQTEAAWALTNIACGTSVETWLLIAIGAADKLCELAAIAFDNEVRDQAVWAISNIAGDSHECREYLLSINAINVCINEFKRPRTGNDRNIQESRSNIIWTLSNLCRSRSSSAQSWHIFAPAIYLIAEIFADGNYEKCPDLLVEACWTLAYLMDGQHNWLPVRAVLDAGLLWHLVRLIHQETRSPDRLMSAAIRAIGNIVTSTEQHTQAVINTRALPSLCQLIKPDSDSLTREVCWLLSNVAAGNEQQVRALVECEDMLPKLILTAGGHRSSPVRRECAWALCNILTGGDALSKSSVITSGCMAPLCHLLDSCDDIRLLHAILSSLETILSIGHEQTTDTFDCNTYAVMLSEIGCSESLRRISQDETKYPDNIRVRCGQIVQEFFENEVVSDTKQPLVIIRFIRKPDLSAGDSN